MAAKLPRTGGNIFYGFGVCLVQSPRLLEKDAFREERVRQFCCTQCATLTVGIKDFPATVLCLSF